MNWRDKFTNFMYGRYGVDQLSRFMLVVIFILCVLSLFVRGSFMSFLILLLIILTYYRMFSKNIYKRAAENEKYLKFIGKFKTLPIGVQKESPLASSNKFSAALWTANFNFAMSSWYSDFLRTSRTFKIFVVFSILCVSTTSSVASAVIVLIITVVVLISTIVTIAVTLKFANEL